MPQAVSLHDRKLNTVHLDANSSLLASSCADGTVGLWDVRQLKAKCRPVATARHLATCQAAYFAPDGVLLEAETVINVT